jgi:hypothetical protein
MLTPTVGTWLAAFLTLGLFSWMYMENPWFRLVEHIYVGAALGVLASQGYQSVVDIAWKPATQQGKALLWVPLIMGALLFSRWSKRYMWVSRSSMGFLVGTLSAAVMNNTITAQLTKQVAATMMPLNNVNNIIFFILTATGTAYFIFTLQAKWASPLIDLGKYGMMIAFGATFGNTVMSRISLFTGRLQFLLFEWLKLTPGGG